MEEKYTPPPGSLAALLMAPDETLPLPHQESTKSKDKQNTFNLPVMNNNSSKNPMHILSYADQKALEKLKFPFQESSSIFNTTLSSSPVEEMRRKLTKTLQEKVSIWGVPLLKDNRTDTILLKFLKARNYQVDEAFEMLGKTILWRKEFNVDMLVNTADIENDLNKVMFIHGKEKDDNLVYYNVYGEFMNHEFYNKMFMDEEKRMKFLLRWIQFLEKSIRMLDFNPGGNSTFLQVNDLMNFPGFGHKKEFKIAITQMHQFLQDNYPEIVANQVFINVPWWYTGFNKMISPFLSRKTKEKFAFASASKSAEILLKHISPEDLLVQYGGLSTNNIHEHTNQLEFTVKDPSTVITLKPGSKEVIEIVVYNDERCLIAWEIRVLGWEVSYGSEYIPRDESAYTIICQKTRKMVPSDEPVVSHCFIVAYEGKMVLTIDNPTSHKKKIIYRSKVTPCPPLSVSSQMA